MIKAKVNFSAIKEEIKDHSGTAQREAKGEPTEKTGVEALKNGSFLSSDDVGLIYSALESLILRMENSDHQQYVVNLSKLKAKIKAAI